MSPPTPAPSVSRIATVLDPRAIAIVGASSDPRSFGGFVLGNLLRFGYRGAIHLVSRSSSQIEGRPCVAAIDDLPPDIDLAVLAIPEAGVLDAVRALGRRRTRAAVLFASGYAETGDAGRDRQQALARVAAEAGVALLGPNCMGFTNVADNVPVTFEPIEPTTTVPARGPAIGVVAQSGAMAANLRDAFVGRGLPITAIVSTGNEADISVEDVVEHYLDDPRCGLVAIYAEQIRRPARFLALARRARGRGTPIVLLLPGRSQRARSAAASHTGALAGDHTSAVVALRREAVVVVETLDELFDVAAVLLRFPSPPTGGVAFMTGSGAMKNVALDFADTVGLALADLSAGTVAALGSMLPTYAVAENPLDYTTIGVRQPGLVGDILRTLLADDAVASLALAIPIGPTVAQRDKSEHIVPVFADVAKPAVLVVTGDDGPLQPFFVDAIRASGVPFFRSVDRALRALARVGEFAESLARARRADRAGAPSCRPLPGPVPACGSFAEHRGKAWLAQAGIAVPPGGLAATPDEAVRIAGRIGWPVVVKIQSDQVPHKTEVGGVIVGVADADALRTAWATLHARLASHRPGLVPDGVLVEAMAAGGLELVVGGKRDPDWGPLVLVGLGGVWIEALGDARALPADLEHADVVAELRRLKGASLLDGVRGAPAVDVAAVARVVVEIGARLRADPSIVEIDVNPLLAGPDGALALDALVVAREAR